MIMNIDDEILQDFLIEAGELFDLLGEQIVELEQNPQDADLLNAIFRAFHTIKGGAGFLKINEMVEVCHRAEDVFDLLRKNEIIADAALIDIILQVIDVVGDMFEQVREGEALTPATAELLGQLESLLHADQATADTTENEADKVADESGTAQAVTEVPATAPIAEQETAATTIDDEFDAMLQAAQETGGTESADSQASASDDLITDEEFEDLLDQIHGNGKHGSVKEEDKADDGLITDDEFEAMLDQIHGEGKHGGVPAAAEKNSNKDDDLITDDEFEAMLDDIHGKGKHGGVVAAAAVAEQSSEDKSKNISETKQAGETAAAVNESSADKSAEPVKSSVDKKITEQATAESASAEKTAAVKSSAGKSPVAKTQARAKPASADSSVRVDTSRLDDIMNLVGELVLVRNRLAMLKQEVKEVAVSDAISNLEIVTSDLQASVMKTRMQPIKKVFNRFPRVIRDLARSLNKDINLQLVGEDTDLDKNLVEALADPMIHLVRNSVDHGIESPEERYKNGKPRQGTVTLSAVQEGDQILLTISDDGKGMDHELLRSIAVKKGLMSEADAARLTEVEAYNLIFAPGFSTKTEISDVSGRGVGMDVVKTKIAELNGTVEIDSTPGEGTVITIRLPLTLAILPTLMVNLADYQFALPLTNVNEAFNMQPEEINIVDGQEVLLVREKPLPLYYLHSWLVRDSIFEGPKTSHKVIVVQMGSQKFCLVVDHLLGQEEVVIKPLGAMLAETPGFAGATITGDGSIALVLDMPSLVKRYAAAY